MTDRLAALPRGRFLALVAIVVLIGLVPQFLSRTLPDIAFLLYAAGEVLDGRTLYVDLIEINPPLIVWLNIPVVALARALGVSEITTYRVVVTLVLTGSLLASVWVMAQVRRRASNRPTVHPSDLPTFRLSDLPTFRLSVLVFAFILFVLPRLDWGEREHLTLALALPYVLLGVARLAAGRTPISATQGAVTPEAAQRPTGAEGSGDGTEMGENTGASAPVASLRGDSPGADAGAYSGTIPALLIGAAAAIGIAIKPQFVLLWVAREGLVLWRTRRVTPEGVIVPVLGAAYLAAVALFAPEYFALVRELGPAYHTFIRNPLLVTALLGDGAALALGALVVAAALWRRIPARNPALGDAALVLTASVAACYLAAVLQQKGWGYHFYPARALAWLLLTLVAATAAASLAASRARWTERLFAAIAGAAAITVAAAAVLGALAQAADPLDSRYDADPSVGQLIPFVREHAAGEPVMVLSPNMASGFPLTTYAGTIWPERYSNLWPLVAAYDSAIRDPAPLEFRPRGEATPIEERLRRTVAEDLALSDPALVLVLATGPDEPRWGMRRLDLLGFLTGDPAFAGAFAHYDSAGVVGQYVVYAREGEPVRIPPRAPGSAAVDAPDEVVLDPAGLAAGVLFIVVLIALYRRAGERGPIAAPQPEPS